MSRLEFYIKVFLIVAVGCVGVSFSDTKAAMISDVKWLTTSICAYLIWHNWDFIPKCSIKFKFWKWGFCLFFKSKKIGVLGPNDQILFSERIGIRKPLMNLYGYRLFIAAYPPNREASAAAKPSDA